MVQDHLQKVLNKLLESSEARVHLRRAPSPYHFCFHRAVIDNQTLDALVNQLTTLGICEHVTCTENAYVNMSLTLDFLLTCPLQWPTFSSHPTWQRVKGLQALMRDEGLVATKPDSLSAVGKLLLALSLCLDQNQVLHKVQEGLDQVSMRLASPKDQGEWLWLFNVLTEGAENSA